MDQEVKVVWHTLNLRETADGEEYYEPLPKEEGEDYLVCLEPDGIVDKDRFERGCFSKYFGWQIRAWAKIPDRCEVRA